jgi:hypothetical protein
MNDAKPLTVGEFKRLIGEMILQSPVQPAPQASGDIFQELKKGHSPPNSKDLH